MRRNPTVGMFVGDEEIERRKRKRLSMSTTTDKPTVEEIRGRHQIASFAFKHMAMPQSATDIGVLLAELDQIEAKHESQLDDACAEIGEIRGCEKCDLCEDHHG